VAKLNILKKSLLRDPPSEEDVEFLRKNMELILWYGEPISLFLLILLTMFV
jgi:hypothetical protein